jgi:PIN domain nuclease of toxin-antitoxin system
VIVLDTHIWVWWVQGDPRLMPEQADVIRQFEPIGLGVSAISCWEVAKLVQMQRLVFSCSVGDWVDQALKYPGVKLLSLTPQIAVESTMLPGDFHKDPADQIIVATARIHQCAVLTADAKILAYPHVQHAVSSPTRFDRILDENR